MNFPCPSCQGSVSETALACPHCGKSFTEGVSTTGAPPSSFGTSSAPYGGFGGTVPSPGPTFSPYAPPGTPAGPMPGLRPPSHEAAAQASRAIQMGVVALFCFAPLAFYALVLAGRAEETARAQGAPAPAAAGTARLVAFAALALWFIGIALRIAIASHR